jgi:septum formation protein
VRSPCGSRSCSGALVLKIILASRSPQRKSLLAALGVKFEAVEPQIEEIKEGEPREVVLENARWKASAVAATAAAGTLVIAGDTEVALDGQVLGQPANEEEARGMLTRLAAREHEVLGAIAMLGPDEVDGRPRAREGLVATTVRFQALSPILIDAYLASGEWEGRAGSYAIQGLGSALVDAVEGDVSNVIGLPITLLLELEPSFQGP